MDKSIFKSKIIWFPALMAGLLIILVIILTIAKSGGFNFLYSAKYESQKECMNDCINYGWDDGICISPEIIEGEQYAKSNLAGRYELYENKGSCIIEASKYLDTPISVASNSGICTEKSQCNCYCVNYNPNFITSRPKPDVTERPPINLSHDGNSRPTAPPEGNATANRKPGSTPCGDGVCDKVESDTGMCPEDCE